MIKKLGIKNFQSHTNSQLEFHPGVNVIIGESQAGKTAIIRALSWLVKNRPTGIRYKNRSSRSNVEVEATFAPGTEVKLVKGKAISEYTLNGQAFSKFGAEVPVEVSEAINIGELNIQSQLDSPFLITDSSYQVSHAINKITKMEESDEWVQTLNTKLMQNGQSKRLLQLELEELANKLHRYEGLERAENLLERAAVLSEKHRELSQLIGFLTLSIRNLRILQNKKTQKTKVLSVKNILQHLIALNEQNQIQADLYAKIQRLRSLKGAWKKYSELANKLTTVLQEIETERTKLLWLNTKQKAIQKLVFLQGEQSQITAQLTSEKEQYIEILEREGVCPTCFSQVTSKQLKSIMRQL
jgi:DNA repair protein SbcC/Rad50